MSVFRQIIPNSFVNSVNERYEYYLVWLSPAGGIRSWLFSHTDGDREETFDNFMIESLTDIRSVPNEQREEVEVNTVSLDSEQFEYVKSIMSSNRVYQVFKDNTRLPIAIRTGKALRENKNKEFGVSVKFVYKEADLLNV